MSGRRTDPASAMKMHQEITDDRPHYPAGRPRVAGARSGNEPQHPQIRSRCAPPEGDREGGRYMNERYLSRGEEINNVANTTDTPKRYAIRGCLYPNWLRYNRKLRRNCLSIARWAHFLAIWDGFGRGAGLVKAHTPPASHWNSKENRHMAVTGGESFCLLEEHSSLQWTSFHPQALKALVSLAHLNLLAVSHCHCRRHHHLPWKQQSFSLLFSNPGRAPGREGAGWGRRCMTTVLWKNRDSPT